MIDSKQDNYIAFQKDDIVCQKMYGETPYGIMSTDPKHIVPFKVLEVIIDTRANERIGELGNSNVYKLQSLIDDKTIEKRYQYQLDLWQNVKDELIFKLEQHINFLKKIN